MKVTWPIVALFAIVIVCSTIVSIFASDAASAQVIPIFGGLLVVAGGTVFQAKQTSDVSTKVDQTSEKVDRVLNGEMEAKIASVIQDKVPGLVSEQLTSHLGTVEGHDSVTPPSGS